MFRDLHRDRPGDTSPGCPGSCHHRRGWRGGSEEDHRDSRSGNPVKGKRRGFTLVEILVALAVLSVLTLLLYLSFLSITNTSSAVEEYSKRTRILLHFLTTLERDLSGAFYTSSFPPARFSLSEVELGGERLSSLGFTAFTPDFSSVLEGATEITAIEYEPEIEENGETFRIVRKVTLNPHIPDYEREVSGTVLTGVRSFRVLAFDNRDDRDGAASWDTEGKRKLPWKVTVEVTLDDGLSVSRSFPLPLTGAVSTFFNSGRRSGS
ncbi:MAG: prepilin-type N-terminal cleavage/methylation domain-containing protein [Deltaproteobacteria bacterium]|nr:MAG: prepilin-type N-terminal cleavage/methylation domain-containing protein [Deltaproteobacteria bacterium]